MSQMWAADFWAPEPVQGKELGTHVLAEASGFQNFCVAEYVWLDSLGATRSKCRTMDKTPADADDCTIWTFNGAATFQAEPTSSDVYLVPRKVFPDPIRGAPHVMVVCECITPAMEPARGNKRAEAADWMEKFGLHDPWFGLEQEYVLVDPEGDLLDIADDTANYCGRGAMALPKGMREIMGDHYAMCLSAGIKISGMNCETGQAQAEFQIGPCKGLNAGDHMVAARHTLHKVAETYGVGVRFAAHYQGVNSGMHCNFSVKATRDDGGLANIEKLCRALSRQHADAVAVYGADNGSRLGNDVGMNAPKAGECTYAVADRTASIRIPRNVGIVAKGYLEDRRPSANADPYQVTAFMIKACKDELKTMS